MEQAQSYRGADPKREFSVIVNGQEQPSTIVPAAKSFGESVYVEYETTAVGTTLEVQLKPMHREPQINAIELIPVGAQGEPMEKPEADDD